MNSPESIHDVVSVSSESGLALGNLGVVFFANIVYSAPPSGSVSVRISLSHPSLDADLMAAAQTPIHVGGAVNVPIPFAATPVSKPQALHPFASRTVGDGMTSALRTSVSLPPIDTTLDTSRYGISPTTVLSKNVENSSMGSVQRIGSDLSTDPLLPPEPLSIVLLVALVGGAITHRGSEGMVGREGEASQ
uniref:NAD(P)H-quinone oxidoreductase subunit 6, chloroplastic n=1 Tax=Selaginella nummulariifolia TaxID=1715387 RepID=A0A650FH10_9TRAC|nr:NADH-plastoquinone oxidoreductase subunit 6 [Selaginella nummulariifolia]